MVCVGRDLRAHLILLFHGQGHLSPDQTAPSPVQPGLGQFQGWEGSDNTATAFKTLLLAINSSSSFLSLFPGYSHCVLSLNLPGLHCHCLFCHFLPLQQCPPLFNNRTTHGQRAWKPENKLHYSISLKDFTKHQLKSLKEAPESLPAAAQAEHHHLCKWRVIHIITQL